MADVTFNSFKGSVPRLAPHLIKPGAAQLALDCKLTSGRLESWREPRKVHSFVGGATVGTSHELNCKCWKDFEGCVDVAHGSPTCQQVFVTGVNDRPTQLSDSPFGCYDMMEWLGLPCPDTPMDFDFLRIDRSNSNRTDAEGRSYAYQYVKQANDVNGAIRSQLSPPVHIQDAYDGMVITVHGWNTAPDPNWGIDTVAIYRTVSGDGTGRQTAKGVDTTWMLVAEIPVSSSSFTDDKWNDELLFAFEDDYTRPPPADLTGLIWIKSINTLAGFRGRELWFSENNNYHNWPHMMTLDDEILGITESNGAVYVATTGNPYVVQGSAGCEDAGCRDVVRLPYSMPMVAPGNRRIASTALGAVYPSHKGLVLLAGKSKPLFLTWPWYSAEDWQQMYPHTAIPVEFDGKLFCFMQNGAFALSLPEGPESGWEADTHTELSDRNVIDAYVTRQGQFLIVKTDGVYEWNRGTALRPHKWVSSEAVFPKPYGMGAGHLWFDGATENIRVTVDGKEVIDRGVNARSVFRLPMWGYGTRWAVTLYGTGSVSLVSLAAAMQDLGS